MKRTLEIPLPNGNIIVAAEHLGGVFWATRCAEDGQMRFYSLEDGITLDEFALRYQPAEDPCNTPAPSSDET